MSKIYYVYILTNIRNTVLYVGVTNNLIRRISEHKNISSIESFTHKYKVCKLVYCESGVSIEGAITREKQIKSGSRQKKIDLVNAFNPGWKDLYDEIVSN